MNETMEAAQGVMTTAKSELAATASKMASSATAEIASAAGNLANAGSKWAYVWMIQRIFDSILSTVLFAIIVFAILYAAMFFMRRFIKMFKETMHSRTFVDKVSDNIKHQIALDNSKMIACVDKSKEDVRLIIEELNVKVRHFEEKLDRYQFEPLQNQLHEVMKEYRLALKKYEDRLAMMEEFMKELVEAKRRENHENRTRQKKHKERDSSR